MTSTILLPLAQALVDLGDGLTLSNGARAKGYLYERVEFDRVPAITVGLPRGSRSGLDAGERELGSDDWLPEFTVSIYVDLDQDVKAQEQAVELLELYVAAVDDDPSLGIATVDDAKVVRWEDFVQQTAKRALYGYELTVAVWRRVPY